MKKNLFTMLVVTALLAATMTVTAFAGEWKQDSKGWWWVNDDGSYPINTWQWIDGNQDGVAECYYFDAVGYMWTNDKLTPDGYQVDVNGAWIVEGAVQTQTVSTKNEQLTNDDNMVGTYYIFDMWSGRYYDWVTLRCQKNSDGTYHVYTVYKDDGTIGNDFTCYTRKVTDDDSMAGTAFYLVGTENEVARFVDNLQEFALWIAWDVEYYGKNLSQ